MDLLRGAFAAASDPAWDVAVSHALLRQVAAAGASGAVLRAYRPHAHVVAFGRRDARLPGFPTAIAAVRATGFTPVVRPRGGRAVAYTEQSLVLDHIYPHADTLGGMDERFATYGKLWARVLSELGIDARVGQVPGATCCSTSSRHRWHGLVQTEFSRLRGRYRIITAASRLDHNAERRELLVRRLRMTFGRLVRRQASGTTST